MFALNGLKVSVLSIYHSILPHTTELSGEELNELRINMCMRFFQPNYDNEASHLIIYSLICIIRD